MRLSELHQRCILDRATDPMEAGSIRIPVKRTVPEDLQRHHDKGDMIDHIPFFFLSQTLFHPKQASVVSEISSSSVFWSSVCCYEEGTYSGFLVRGL